ALGIELTLASVFNHPTLAGCAAALGELGELGQQPQQAQGPALTRISREQALPLSFAQQRLWFLAQMQGGSEAYNMPWALQLQGPLDVQALRRSVDALMARHEALRSVFVSEDGEPRVVLLEAAQGMPWQEHDLRGQPDAQEQLSRLSLEEAHAAFDLSRGPLVRARLVQLDDQRHVFMLTQHHIVSDGWSMGVLVTELSALYGAFSQGQDDPLQPLQIQYPDYAAWQRQWLTGEQLSKQEAYWREQLADAPVRLELPTDKPRPAQQDYAGSLQAVRLDAELTRGLKRLGQRHGVTLYMTLLGAWAAVLGRLSGQSDLVIGSPTANRGRQEVEPLIGFFVNTLALRLDLSGPLDTRELLERVRRVTLGAQEHQDLPFEQVVEIVNPPRRLEHTPLFQVMFAWQSNEQGSLALPGLEVRSADMPLERVKFDLELHLALTQEGTIAGALNYASALFEAETMQRQSQYLETLLRGMVAQEEQAIAQIALVGEGERRQLLQEWNQTQVPYPGHSSLTELFEQQAMRTPQAVALVEG
ncbi:condensation domain-containing protein, partial [Roseateles sp. DB2]|uniref:condensation domain-containing protein n=1 Tax=Roseateles sp. DB2 TaxID=3453717 RepID=UPI003EE89A25